jgi:paired amphipathic helix protein Sin3a
MNRRHYSLINKPLSELDLTSIIINLILESQRICTSYSELPAGYPNLISSGRTPEIAEMLNDKFISIPAGSEDDKNPMKKNHYQEHIFKFEDQRYENDMIIEILKFAMDGLNELNEKVSANGLATVSLESNLSKSIIRFISRFYKEYGQQVLEGIEYHPKDTIPIVINRFKKRLDEAQSQKTELEKNIKASFDRFYFKSFDYRSFKFKNYDKKTNNAKAFLKEIQTRKKEKKTSLNLNIVKGGTENFEFYSTLNLKFLKDNVQQVLKTADDELYNKTSE